MARQGPRRYAVLHRYSSGEHGPWEMGTTVELTPTQAAWVNRDSPGTLAEVKPGTKLTTGQPVPPSKLLDHPDEEQPEPQPASAPEPEPEPEPEPVASTKQEGAPVATAPRGRGRGARSGRGS
jgi:hypothetical protein